MDWFTSDLHLDHIKMLSHRSQFNNSVDEMNHTILKAFDVVKKGDRVFILGDFGWKLETVDFLLKDLLNKKKAIVFWLEGNHDHVIYGKVAPHKNLHRCQTMYIKGHGNYQPIFMSHYPQLLWEKSYFGSYMIHGHGHVDTSDRPMLDNLVLGKRLNVNIELNNYKLWSRDDVEEYMKSRPNNVDLFLTHGNDEQKDITKGYLEKISDILSEMYFKLGDFEVNMDDDDIY